MFNFIKSMTLVFILIILSSCGGHLVKDIHPNPAKQGYHRMEFNIKNGDLKKEIGVGNILLKEGQELKDIYFEIVGIYKGTLHIKSSACGIDVNTNFNGKTKFLLDDLVPNPTKCSIRLTATTEPLKKRQHNIVETGVIKINVIPSDSKPVSMSYIRTNTITKKLYTTYIYEGQGSMQRQAGDLTRNEKFTITMPSENDSGSFRIIGCGKELPGTYKDSKVDVSLYDLYKKNKLTEEDSCDFEITTLPDSRPFSDYGRFSINIYGEEVIKLEPLKYEIKKKFASKKKKIKAEGSNYMVICSINDSYKIKNKCSHDYEKDKVYWLRAITSNARKSVFAVKNGEIYWKE
jgi:hypothetical protein